jgi:hypothetical protein
MSLRREARRWLLTVGGQSPQAYEQMLREFAIGAREADKDPTFLVELNGGVVGASLDAYGREVLPRLRAVTASTDKQPRDTRRAA